MHWLLIIERTEYFTLTLNSTPWHIAELRGHSMVFKVMPLKTGGFSGRSNGKRPACSAGDLASSPESGRREWPPTPVFLPGEFHNLHVDFT